MRERKTQLNVLPSETLKEKKKKKLNLGKEELDEKIQVRSTGVFAANYSFQGRLPQKYEKKKQIEVTGTIKSKTNISRQTGRDSVSVINFFYFHTSRGNYI